MRWEVITAPTERVLDLDDVKAHLRIEADHENALLVEYLDEATQYLQDGLKQTMLTTVYDEYFPCFCNPLLLTWGPVQSIDTITYKDPDNQTQTLDSAVYEQVPAAMPGRVRLAFDQVWPDVLRHPDSVVVRYSAGYAQDETGVPQWLKGLLRKYVGAVYEYREGSLDKPPEVLKLAFENEIWARTARRLV